MAIAALVLGVIGVIGCMVFLPSVLAVIFGILGLRGIKKSGGTTRGKGMAITGLVLGAVGVLAGAGFWVAAAVTDSATSARLSDCVSVPAVGEVVEKMEQQDCDKAHDGEVVGKGTLSGAGNDPYPSDAELEADVNTRCLKKFERYTGQPLDDATHDLFYIYPTEKAWKSGDGTFLCVAALDDGQLTKSLEG